MSHQVYVESLDAGAHSDVNIALDVGKSYHFVGVCDGDCSDIDLSLRSPNGHVTDEDNLEDDHPMVAVSPSRGGTYVLRVTMVACSANPCRFGIGSFSK